MKRVIILTLRLLIFWMVFFAIQQTLFLLYNRAELKGIPFGHVMLSYYYAIGMNISTACYLMALPAIFLIAAIFIKKKSGLIYIIHTVNIILIIGYLLIALFDIGLYSVWGTKINSKAIAYIMFPKEAIISVKAVPYWAFIMIMVAEATAAIFVYKRYFRPGYVAKIKFLYKAIFSFVLLVILFVGMRGGLQKYPINRSWVYYSKYPVLNYASMNGFWNFMEIVMNPDIKENPYKYFSKEKAEAIVKKMHETTADSTKFILTTSRPNIVLILMESVSAENMASLNGIKGVMPGLDSLSKDGLLFTDFYANGFRTEQGIMSYITSFPAQPKTTIMRKIGKYYKLPNLTRTLGENGYSINYYYSGNLEFANTDAFLKYSGFTHIFDKDNYEWKRTTEWGAYDEELFACHLKEAEKDSQPFFSIIMTSTSHEEFDADVEKVFTSNSTADKYKNTVHYTDKCVSDYLKSAKSKPWYNNTIFIITADHAHKYPNDRSYNAPERHRIPLLFYGNVLKKELKGKENHRIGSQIDLAAMILAQLKIPYSTFTRSKNMFNVLSPEFAYYTFDNGFGIITPKQILVYDHNLGQVVYRKNKLSAAEDEEILNEGKAYLQVMFEEYIGFIN